MDVHATGYLLSINTQIIKFTKHLRLTTQNLANPNKLSVTTRQRLLSVHIENTPDSVDEMSRFHRDNVERIYGVDADSYYGPTAQPVAKFVRNAIEKVVKRLKARGKRALERKLMKKRYMND
ncbi:hypothetical protein FSPOR_4209 [Fusarium sporotrichioides]|uniref:Uncharacterized protein n=1 Tax=Fusarium sporotrichioides TaxID=5514 RepID=A0A395SD55_FUSSP|nr:hypothetical protein FSPOR_4209 [Fusarium sporotrichioides]